MHRTQVMLEEEQHRFLVDEARRKGESIAALIRQLIDEYIRAQSEIPLEQDPLWDMVGIAHGGLGKVSEEHDQYLAETRLQRMSRHTKSGD